MREFKLNDKKVINGWAFFDWANSAYALVISSAIFPLYFLDVTDKMINLLGWEVTNSGLYAFSVTIAYIIMVILSPILSGIADYTGRRKFFLKFFTILGSLSCMSLFFFKGMDTIWIGVLGFIFATVGFSGCLVFYNSYLPQIVTPDMYDKVSAKGYAFGYVGSVLLLIFNLWMILQPETFGLDKLIGLTPEWLFGSSVGVLSSSIAFLTVGLWWIGFAQITFKYMPPDKNIIPEKNVLLAGYQEIRDVWYKIKPEKNIKRFLTSYFFYTMGVQTILYMAGTFAKIGLDFSSSELITLILVLQLVGIGGAYLFADIAKNFGSKASLMSMLFIWIAICLTTYFIHQKFLFYVIAGFVGLVMGGIQAISRSTYAKLIEFKEGEFTSYYSFYDVLQKLATVFGTLSFGYIEQISGGMRPSILTLGIYFIIGMAILAGVEIKKQQYA